MMTLRTILLTCLALVIVGCQPGEKESQHQGEEWGTSVNGLRCRLFIRKQEGMLQFDRDIKNLVLEIENANSSSVFLPVYWGHSMPLITIHIREEPEVESPPNFGNKPTVLRLQLSPGSKLTWDRLWLSHHIAYGKRNGPDWIQFTPNDQAYHLTAKVKTESGVLTSNTIGIRLK